MMYMHYCSKCRKIHMLNGHKPHCPRCSQPLTELRINYLDYIGMTSGERDAYTMELTRPERLSALSTTYRMYKYSKWYKDLTSSSH